MVSAWAMKSRGKRKEKKEKKRVDYSFLKMMTIDF